jgi:hypothetical protein
MTKPPPVPAQNRSPKGTGESKSDQVNRGGLKGGAAKGDPHQRGQQANTAQNTTHQGHQQDR